MYVDMYICFNALYINGINPNKYVLKDKKNWYLVSHTMSYQWVFNKLKWSPKSSSV